MAPEKCDVDGPGLSHAYWDIC